MLKRLFTVMLVFSFLTFIFESHFLVPNYAFALTEEEQAKQDEEQARLVTTLLGLALLVYIGTTLSKHNYSNLEHKSLAQKQVILNRQPFNFRVGLDYSKSSIKSNYHNNPLMRFQYEFRSPELVLSIKW